MSVHDADMYAKIVGKVRNQVQALRVMLSSIEVYDVHCFNIINSVSSMCFMFFLPLFIFFSSLCFLFLSLLSPKTWKDNG